MTSSCTLFGFCTLFKRKTLHNLKYLRFASSIQFTKDPFLPGVTEIIDARIPSQYETDHLPGAINLPVLQELESEFIRKTYKENPFEGKKRGTRMVIHNISNYVGSHFKNKDENYKPLIYCKQGGQRSRSLAKILHEFGYSVALLEGGYMTYRRKVMEDLETLPKKFTYKVIAGMAGCGKTYLLSQLSDLGEQILDLEGLAKHKDFLFGGFDNGDQPSQNYFEGLIAKQFSSFDNNKIVWIETKSIRIGKLSVPQELFKKMCTSDCYIINLPMQERVNHIIRHYKYFTEDLEGLKSRLSLQVKYYPSRKISEWISMAEKGQWKEFVEELLVNCYDPTYTRSQTRHNHGEKTSVVDLDDLSSDSIHRCLKNMIEESRASVSEAVSNE